MNLANLSLTQPQKNYEIKPQHLPFHSKRAPSRNPAFDNSPSPEGEGWGEGGPACPDAVTARRFRGRCRRRRYTLRWLGREPRQSLSRLQRQIALHQSGKLHG